MNKLNQLWSDLRGSLWFVPGLMILASIILALALVEFDSRADMGWLEDYPLIFGLGADGARGMLTAIASSMLTVAALTFSLTLSAVSQASGQFTPRIFRNFMRDRANQFVLGYFVSVFAFCLLVLRTIRGADDLKFVPSISVLTGLMFAIGGILVLIFFIHHISASLQITTILDRIADESTKAIEHQFPQEMGEAATIEEKVQTREAFEGKEWRKVHAEHGGYVQSVDADGLLDLASSNDLLIRMRLGIGEYAGRGSVLAELACLGSDVRPKDKGDIESVLKMFSVGKYRTIEQDVGYGIRQIVDIALKALSPGVNDTTTAINCIDKLSEVVGELARRRMPEKVRSKGNVARVTVVAPGFADYVESAFDQIRISGKANQAVFEQLIAALLFIAECTEFEDRRRVLASQIGLIDEYAEQTLATAYERGKVQRKISEAKIVLKFR